MTRAHLDAVIVAVCLVTIVVGYAELFRPGCLGRMVRRFKR